MDIETGSYLTQTLITEASDGIQNARTLTDIVDRVENQLSHKQAIIATYNNGAGDVVFGKIK